MDITILQALFLRHLTCSKGLNGCNQHFCHKRTVVYENNLLIAESLIMRRWTMAELHCSNEWNEVFVYHIGNVTGSIRGSAKGAEYPQEEEV